MSIQELSDRRRPDGLIGPGELAAALGRVAKLHTPEGNAQELS